MFIDRPCNGDGADSVVVDNVRGAYLAAEHLISRGHTKIAIIASEREFSSGHDRVLGFEQALRNKNVRIWPQYIYVGSGTEKDGYAGAFRLMNLTTCPASPPLSRSAAPPWRPFTI